MQLGPTFVQQAVRAVQAHQQQQQRQQQLDNEQHSHSAGATGPCLSPAALLQYVPLPGEVQDSFLGQVSAAIMDGMRQQTCVLTASGQLSTANKTLLPSPLLVRADGSTPLIPPEWLVAGLPEVQFVHPNLLVGSQQQQQRAMAVLQELGSKNISTQLLLQWLADPGTAQVLQQLPWQQRSSWLRDLYSCLNALTAQPAGSIMHLGPHAGHSIIAQQQWRQQRQQLSWAPILQLHGVQRLESFSGAAVALRKVYLWDTAFGGDDELQLFCSGQLCFIDRATLTPAGAAVLRQLLGLEYATMSVLVEALLQQQAEAAHSGMFQLKVHHQQLLFLLRNSHRLSPADCKQLQQRLLLQRAEGSCGIWGSPVAVLVPAEKLYLPLQQSSSLQLPHELLSNSVLRTDLAAAGVQFVSSGYQDLTQQLEGRQHVWQLLQRCGVRQLSRPEPAEALLRLYSDSRLSSSIRQQQHMLHLRCLCLCASEGHKQDVANTLLLYDDQQNPAKAAPAWHPNQPLYNLYWHTPDDELPAALDTMLRCMRSMVLLHPCYLAAGGSCAEMVKELCGQLTPDVVSNGLSVQVFVCED